MSTGVKWLAGAFALEQLVFVVAWLLWLSNDTLAVLYAKDLFAGMFFSVYGLNDLAFMLFFAWIFFATSTEEPGTGG